MCICMLVYSCIYMHVCDYMCTCVYEWMCVCLHTCIYVYSYLYMHMYICMCMHKALPLHGHQLMDSKPVSIPQLSWTVLQWTRKGICVSDALVSFSVDIHAAVWELDHMYLHFESWKNLCAVFHSGHNYSHSSQQRVSFPCQLLSCAYVVLAILQGTVTSHYGETHLLRKLINSLTSTACATDSKPRRNIYEK